MFAHVGEEVGLKLELAATHATLVGQHLVAQTLVRVEVGDLRKTLSAQIAQMAALARMREKVTLEVRRLREAFGAHGTHVRRHLPPVLEADVRFEAGASRERRRAVLAAKRLLAGVHQVVGGEIVTRVKRRLANAAHETLQLVEMRHPVASQSLERRERFGAHVARQRRVVHANVHVFHVRQQIGLGGERLARAQRALKGPLVGVSAFVVRQLGAQSESLAAEAADEASVVGGAHVASDGRRRRKTQAASRANRWDAGGDVRVESVAALEASGTGDARMRKEVLAADVSADGLLRLVAPAAEVARQKRLQRRRASVRAQFARRRKAPAAAHVAPLPPRPPATPRRPAVSTQSVSLSFYHRLGNTTLTFIQATD